jgi:hypothetical protein
VRRLLLLLLVALLLPAAAHAQSPAATPAQADDDPGLVDDPGDAVEDPGDDVGDDTGDEESGDYYCIPGDSASDDCGGYGNCGGDDAYYGEYYYCNPAAGQGNPPPKDHRGPRGENAGGGTPPAEAGAALPRTGDSPLLIALFGFGLVLAGTGGRLLTAGPRARRR